MSLKLSNLLQKLNNQDFTYKAGTNLKSYTTIKLSGVGDILVVKSVECLQELVPILKSNSIDFSMVGIGANQVLKGGEKLYLKLNFPFDRTYLDELRDEYVLPASVPLSLLTNTAKKHGLKKWDYLTGIPATLGGAVFMNAGISAGEIGEIVSRVKLLNSSGEIREVKIDQNSFSYRKNHFVNENEIIIEVALKNLGVDKNIPSIIDRYLEQRTLSQPWKEKTCGCVFKNYSTTCRAGHFIDIINLKGFTYKGIKISNLHGNFFVNYGDSSIEDFLTFINIVQNELKLQFGIDFELEVQIN